MSKILTHNSKAILLSGNKAIESPEMQEYTNGISTRLSELNDFKNLDLSSQVIWLVYDIAKAIEWNTTPYTRHRPLQNVTVEEGYLSNGSFVTVNTISVTAATYWSHEIPTNLGRFVVYKITSSVNIVRFGTYSSSPGSYNPFLVAVRYNLPYHTTGDILISNTYCPNILSIYQKNSQCLVTASGQCIDWTLENVSFTTATNMFYGYKAPANIVNFSNCNITCAASLQGFCNSDAMVTKFIFGNVDTSATTSIGSMFQSSYLTELDLSHFDFSNVTTAGDCFRLPSLLHITGWTAIPVSYSLANCTQLDHNSLIVVINSLPTVSTTQTLTLGSTLQAKLTAEEIAVATAKGWTVA